MCAENMCAASTIIEGIAIPRAWYLLKYPYWFKIKSLT